MRNRTLIIADFLQFLVLNIGTTLSQMPVDFWYALRKHFPQKSDTILKFFFHKLKYPLGCDKEVLYW